MLFTRAYRLSLRLFVLSAFAGLGLAGCRPAAAQSLRFAPISYTVPAIDPTSTTTTLNGPHDVATDVFGNLYVGDTNNRLIRKVDPTGTATILVGNGGYGFSGDGGSVNSAQITYPGSMATDLAGNLYFIDVYNYVVRKVTPAGIITTYAGNHTPGSSGDGGLATDAQVSAGSLATDALGNLYISDYTSLTIRVVNSAGVISTYAGGGAVTGALAEGAAANTVALNPGAIATDPDGALYLASDCTIRKITTAGLIYTYAGTGSCVASGDGGQATNAGLYYPAGLTADAFGNVYVGDSAAKTVRRINSDHRITTFAGTGQIAQAFSGVAADKVNMNFPSGLAASPAGDLYIVVPSQDVVYRLVTRPWIFPETRLGSTSRPQRFIVENTGNSNITLSSVTMDGDFHIVVDTSLPSNNPCSTNIPLEPPYNNTCTIDVVFTPTAEGLRSFALTVQSDDTPSTLTQTLTSTSLGSALAMNTGMMYIVAGQFRAQYSDAPGLDDGNPALAAKLAQIYGLTVDSAGSIFFTQGAYCQIQKVDGNTGILSLFAGAHPEICNGQNVYISGDNGAATDAILDGLNTVSFDPSGNLYTTDQLDSRVRKIDSSGIITNFAGTGLGEYYITACGYSGDNGLATAAQLCHPWTAVSDKNGNIYIADTDNNVVRKVDTLGVITTVAGNQAAGAGFSGDFGPAVAAQLNGPRGLAIDSAGDIYIADSGNDVIRKVDATNRNITTIAGFHGVQSYSGDGGSANRSTLALPEGLALDAAGDLFIADSYNMVIRKIDTAGIITTVAGSHLSYDDFSPSGLLATATYMSFPASVAVSSSGYIYVADTTNGVIREMAPNGSMLFGPQGVSSTSASQTVTLSNIGNTPMHFDATVPTEVSGDFALATGGTCNFSSALAVGASCTVNISFTPTAQGTRNGVFAFFDDGVASPQYVALQGSGTTTQAQSINFRPISTQTYGAPSFDISASASSGLPVTYSVLTGNALVSLSGNTLTILGAGQVTIAADQAGDGTYSAAPQATQTLTINPATLTITAQPASSQVGQPIAPLTYAASGFQYSDTKSVLSGAPDLSTTARTTSNAATYPITIAAGSLSAANYTFNFVPGTYTLTPAPVTGPPATPTIVVTATMTLSKLPTTGGYAGVLLVRNTGTGAAANVNVSSVKIGTTVATGVPKALGSIPAGGSSSFAVSFPASIGNSGAAAAQSIAGAYTGGTFGGSLRITLP